MIHYVVRYNVDEDEVKYKVFEKRPEAENLFLTASFAKWDGDLMSCAWFEVIDTDNVRLAIAAVESGNKAKVRLLDVCGKNKFDIDLEALGL